MDPPACGDEVKPEKLEKEKEGGPFFHCDLFDSEVVHKIAQALLPGLASACVDNTTGGLMRSAGSVAVDIRREMVDYLLQRSENFVAESVVLDGGPDAEVSDHPFNIVSDFIDDFASSKRNFFSKVSEWILSDRREDRIDDFVQEMELDGFWLIGRREAVAQTLLKNVDFKNEFHCDMKFKIPEELDEHRLSCKFKTVNCMNEGCDSRFSAAHLEHHDSVCPFKILPCEQKCSESIMRREMDRHCITLCPMKLVNCPFYPLGCKSTIPQCRINEHRLDDLHSHLLYVLQVLHKEVSTDDLKKRVEQIDELSSPKQLAALRDARSLAYAVKDLDAKLGPIEETKPKSKPGEVDPESMDKNGSLSSTTSGDNRVSVDKKESSASPEQRAASPDPRSVVDAAKDRDAKVGPIQETKPKLKPGEEDPESMDKKESLSSTTSEDNRVSIDEKESSASPEQLAASPDPRSVADAGKDRDAKLGPLGETKIVSKPSEEDRESIDKKETSASHEQLASSRDAGSSSNAVKELDAKIGPTEESKIKSRPSEEDKESIDIEESSASPQQLAASRDARSSVYAVKDLDAKLGPVEETKIETKPSEEDRESIREKEASASSTTSEENRESIDKIEENSASSMTSEEGMKSPSKNGEFLQSTTKDHDCTEPPRENEGLLSQLEDSIELQVQREKFPYATMEDQKQIKPLPEEEHGESTTRKAERTLSPAKRDKHAESFVSKEASIESPPQE